MAPRSLLRWWGPAIAHASLIFALSSRSTLPELPGGMTDKLAHGLAYGVLAALIVRALARGRAERLTLANALAAVALSAAYGATDEWHQRFVPGRMLDARDLAADATGAAVAAVGLWACGIIWRSRRIREGRAEPR